MPHGNRTKSHFKVGSLWLLRKTYIHIYIFSFQKLKALLNVCVCVCVFFRVTGIREFKLMIVSGALLPIPMDIELNFVNKKCLAKDYSI